MDNRILISSHNGLKFFYFEKLDATSSFEGFCCSVPEYNEYLTADAVRSRNDHIALTWLLRDREQKRIVSYMSLITDSIKISIAEKKFHSLQKRVPELLPSPNICYFAEYGFVIILSFGLGVHNKFFALVCVKVIWRNCGDLNQLALNDQFRFFKSHIARWRFYGG